MDRYIYRTSGGRLSVAGPRLYPPYSSPRSGTRRAGSVPAPYISPRRGEPGRGERQLRPVAQGRLAEEPQSQPPSEGRDRRPGNHLPRSPRSGSPPPLPPCGRSCPGRRSRRTPAGSPRPRPGRPAPPCSSSPGCRERRRSPCSSTDARRCSRRPAGVRYKTHLPARVPGRVMEPFAEGGLNPG